MLIDGTVKHFPTAIVGLDTPYLSGRVQALCMDDLVHDVIIGNVPGAKDPQLNCESSTPMTIVPDIEIHSEVRSNKPQEEGTQSSSCSRNRSDN